MSSAWEEERESKEEALCDAGKLLNCYKCRDILASKYGLDWTLPKNELARRLRQLQFENHPDRGGDADRFNEISTCSNYLSRMIAASTANCSTSE